MEAGRQPNPQAGTLLADQTYLKAARHDNVHFARLGAIVLIATVHVADNRTGALRDRPPSAAWAPSVVTYNAAVFSTECAFLTPLSVRLLVALRARAARGPRSGPTRRSRQSGPPYGVFLPFVRGALARCPNEATSRTAAVHATRTRQPNYALQP